MAGKKSGGAQIAQEQQIEKKIRVKIDRTFDDPERSLKAIASANIGDYAVHGFRVYENQDGLYVQMPSQSFQKDGKTEYTDIFHPVTKEARQELCNEIAQEYRNQIAQAQGESQTATAADQQPAMQKM